jgi:acyl carrier protein
MSTVDSIVRDIVRAHASRAMTADELVPDAALGSDGLGLDSIAIAEVLLDCQQRFGVGSMASLLEGDPLTLHRLIEYLQQETLA